MKKNKQIIYMIFLCLLSSNCSNLKKDCTKLLGTWEFANNNEIQNFQLTFLKNNSEIFGIHCFIKGKNGDKIDCNDENSILLNCKKSVILGEVASAYAENSIKIELNLISNDSLKIKTLSDPDMSFFNSEMIFIKK